MEALERQLHFICGKGGVGKSVVACALARHFHRQGKRVLLVQVNAPDSHSRLLGTTPIGSEMRELERGFHVVNSTAAAAMKEYALMTLKFEALYRTVFENRLTKVFLRFVPSLTELTIQGKIWFHAEEHEGGRPRFDRIIVDCPSTGHGIKFLRVAQIVRDASRVGPMAEKTRLMAELVENPARTRLHVVTLPEELPVNEAKELVQQVRETRAAPLGLVFFNQRLQRLFDDDAAARIDAISDLPGFSHARRPLGAAADLDKSGTVDRDDEALRDLVEVAKRRRQREQVEREMRARIEQMELPVIELPMLLNGPLGKSDVEAFAGIVARASSGARA